MCQCGERFSYSVTFEILCTHKKTSEPTDEQVDELIAGVNSVIKNVF